MRRQIKLLLAVVCFGLSVPARAWDPNKPFIYEMRIAFETDNWINMYSTATVLSKSDNREAFRVVANSTTAPVYQLVVTTQGYVGISTGNPQAKFHVSGGDSQFGDGSASTISASGYMTFANLNSTPTASAGRIYYDSSASKLRLSTGTADSSWSDVVIGNSSGDLSVTGSLVGIDSYTKLLLHMNGDNGSTTFLDSAAGKAVTASNATITTSQSKFGGASGSFNGTNGYLTIPDSDDWDFGSGDFTLEAQCYFSDVSDNLRVIFSKYHDSPGTREWLLFWSPANGGLILYLSTNGTIVNVYPVAWTPTINTWYHIAIVRNGNDLKFYVNGTQLGDTKDVTGVTVAAVSTEKLAVGAYHSGGYGYFKGSIDEARISKGVARWTSNFTPPAREYGTVLAGDVAASSLILRATDGTNCYRLTVNNSGAQTTTLVPCP